jgi:predicted porin
MKKTLIALAVLAASGASFAQATITGTYTFGYKQTQAAGASSVGGIGTDTAAVQFAASEDLGGGLKASAKVSIANANRDGAVSGEDAALNLTGGFGSLTMGTVESGNGLLAIGSSGAAGFGLDGNVLSGSSNIDIIAYGLPLGNGLTLGASYVDRGAAATTTTATAGTGLGVGSSGTTNAQPSMTLGLTYAAGPLAAKIDVTSWSRSGDADIAQGTGTALVTGATAAPALSRYRLSAGYDFGMARLSAGFSRFSKVGDRVDTETLVGVKVPFGGVTLGLDYGMSDVNTAGTKSAEKSGYSLGASYALSKRTSVSASYLNWSTRGTDGTNTGFRTYISHSF